jgi:hypothetical protein
MKIAILSKAMYIFNSIPTKIQMILLKEIEKSIPQFLWNYKRLHIAKATLSKKTNLEVSQ